MHKLSRKIICLICCLFIITNTMYAEGSGEVYLEETEFCSISDFEDFHYYLFCNTNLGSTSSSFVNAFIGSGAETSEAGVELYQKFMEPFRECGYEGYMELSDISPDCQFVITKEGEERSDFIKKWRLFDGETEIGQKEADDRYYCASDYPFRIIKNGDAYRVTDGETFDGKVDRLYEQTGYRPVKFNEQGNLAAGDERSRLNDTWEMSICDLESAEILLTFYQGNEYGYVWQIQGDKESGKVVYKLGKRDFYEYAYPSGEIKYLGKDMYYPRYSPDGKYIAYSSPDMEACYGLDEAEAEEVLRILPGIYILEVETGKTAYIKQDVDDSLITRTFKWVEKDCFEQVMEEE